MGLYDREYYREETPRRLEFGGQRAMVTNLVIINVALYVLDIFSEIFTGRSHWLMEVMTATPDSLVKPWLWWQLISYGFAHSTLDVWHLVWNMFGLWMFGRDVEGILGRKEILRIYLVSVVLGSLFWTARQCLSTPQANWDQVGLVGASGAVTAVILLFCIHFPKRIVLLMFVLPVPAWILGLLIIAINLMNVGAGGDVAYDVHLVGAAFAICYHWLGWNLGHWSPLIALPANWWKPRPRLRVHNPGGSRDDLDDKADEVLAKVNRDGIESLTTSERRILEDYSRRLRQKQR